MIACEIHKLNRGGPRLVYIVRRFWEAITVCARNVDVRGQANVKHTIKSGKRNNKVKLYSGIARNALVVSYELCSR